jgi:uncharacterized protein with PQ loop repeat
LDTNFIQLLGWVPALIFPIAAALQLFKICANKRADGVSASAWIAFGIANLCLFGYTEKYTELQTIIGMVGQAAIDFTIAGFAIYYIKTHRLLERAGS